MGQPGINSDTLRMVLLNPRVITPSVSVVGLPKGFCEVSEALIVVANGGYLEGFRDVSWQFQKALVPQGKSTGF